MSLRFIYGRAGSGKSNFCYDGIKRELNKNINQILLVPEQFSFQSEKNLIKKISSTGILNAQVLSFKRLAYKVFSEVGGLTHNHMNSSGKCMLVYKIMKDLKEELGVFNTSAKQEGFSKIISDLISEFKNYNVTPLDISNAILDIEEDEYLTKKLQDISLIYGEYEKKLHENYIDSEDDLGILCEKIDESKYLEGTEVWIDEFNSFTPKQYSIIEKLLKKAKRVNVTINMSTSYEKNKDEDIFFVTINTENKLKKIAEDNNISIEKSIELWKKPYPRFKTSEELSYLEENIFNYTCEKYKLKTKDISIFKANNSYEEIENLSENIIKLCKEKGYRYKDIAVITRDLSIYESIIKAIFEEYEIPCFIDKKKEIDQNPLIILIRSSMEIFTRNWSYEAVFRYVKSGLLTFNSYDVDILENYVLASGIKGKKKWTSSEKWDTYIQYGFEKIEDEEKKEALLERINEIRYKITEPLVDFYKNINEAKNAKEFCEAAFNFLCKLKIPETTENWIESFKKQGNQEKALEYSGIWNLVVEILDQVVEVMGNEKLFLDEFIKIITIGFSQNKMGIIPPALDQVLVSSVDRLKSHEVKAVFIIGVNEGVFPMGNTEEGIFTDGDRFILQNANVKLGNDTKTKALEEQFLVYSTLSMAKSYIRISYPIADHEGRTLRPSVIISRLRNIFPNILNEEDILNEEVGSMEKIIKPIPTFNRLILKMREKKDISSLDPIWKQVYLWYSSQEDWKNISLKVFQGFTYSNKVNKIGKDRINKLYGGNVKVSVSRMERYVRCPFAYYVQYGLKAKDRKIFKLSSPDVGTFMHKVIDDFSHKVKSSNMHWGELSKSWCEENVNNSVSKVINETTGSILTSSPRYLYFTKRLTKVILRSIWLIVMHMQKSNFEPLGYEMTFEEGGDFPPIEITLKNNLKVKLIGRIDRIDKLVCEEGVFYRIIDYKSGSKDFKLSDVYYGLQIQLMTYLDAIIKGYEVSKKEKALPAGVLYFKLDNPIIKENKNISEKEIEEAIMKELKMRGLVLADTNIVKAMDKDIELQGTSLIIPAELKKKDGSLSARSSIATVEQFYSLREHVRKNLIETCEKMLEGEISIRPFRKKDSIPCTYCTFSSLCRFDTSLESSKYNIIQELKDNEVWDKLEERIVPKKEEEN
ncbi:helicase-exonuclease AddAB subunit AddB [Haloimpatiens sp. FM7315]|uniref:helicase-exonuclease AddAB subunit AddB n=1 Tax=Haloimpatiens sp. FM7315 TaxID=3298609 RepID=UPI003977475D